MRILFLHGWGQDKNVWNNIISKFEREAGAIDLPGFGKEKLVSKNWTISDYAKWVISKIDKDKKYVIVGHSFGGRVAAEIASKNPKWLSGLVLSAAPCVYKPSNKTKLKILIYKFLKNFVPSRLRGLFYSIDQKNAKKLGLYNIFKNSVVYDQKKSLSKIKVPTLLIWGEADSDVPLRIAIDINRLIKNSQLRSIEGATHNSFIDNPNLFYGYVRSFIQSI